MYFGDQFKYGDKNNENYVRILHNIFISGFWKKCETTGDTKGNSCQQLLNSFSETIDYFNLFGCKFLRFSTVFIRRKYWTLIKPLEKKTKNKQYDKNSVEETNILNSQQAYFLIVRFPNNLNKLLIHRKKVSLGGLSFHVELKTKIRKVKNVK